MDDGKLDLVRTRVTATQQIQIEEKLMRFLFFQGVDVIRIITYTNDIGQ